MRRFAMTVLTMSLMLGLSVAQEPKKDEPKPQAKPAEVPKTTETKTEAPKDAKAPTHVLFHIEERKNDKSFYRDGWGSEFKVKVIEDRDGNRDIQVTSERLEKYEKSHGKGANT